MKRGPAADWQLVLSFSFFFAKIKFYCKRQLSEIIDNQPHIFQFCLEVRIYILCFTHSFYAFPIKVQKCGFLLFLHRYYIHANKSSRNVWSEYIDSRIIREIAYTFPVDRPSRFVIVQFNHSPTENRCINEITNIGTYSLGYETANYLFGTDSAILTCCWKSSQLTIAKIKLHIS